MWDPQFKKRLNFYPLGIVIVEYTIPGDVQYIVVSGTNSRLYTRYEPLMEFLSSHTGYEMA